MVLRLAGSVVLLTLIVGGFFATKAVTLAQDSTPAGDCVETTEEENIAIVESHIAAFEAGEFDDLNDTLHPDFSHNLSRGEVEVPNETGNEDEIDQAEAAGDVDGSVDDIFASGDQVVVRYTFTVDGDMVEGAAPGSSATVTTIAIVQIECGQIKHMWAEFDSLGLVLQLGINVEASDATPAA